MKPKTQSPKPTRSKLSVLRQLCNFIPHHLVSTVARETGVAKQARTYLPWRHVLALLFAQLTHSLGLNDVCDALRLHSGPLAAIRGATPPSRNNLSHANRERDSTMAESLFWRMLEHLQSKRQASYICLNAGERDSLGSRVSFSGTSGDSRCAPSGGREIRPAPMRPVSSWPAGARRSG
jgi:hypothetical protein